MKEFKTYLMEDLIEEIAMGPFGSNIKVDCFVDSGVPVLNGANLQGFKLREDSFNYVTTEKADSLNKANAYRGDIVITHRGTLGQIVYIPQDSLFERYVISQSQFRVRVNKNLALPEYVVYFFHTRIGQHRLLANASQVGVPAIARPSTMFKKVEINLPSLKEQERIVGVLSSLSDKIELNNRINHNLDEQAILLVDHFLSSKVALSSPKRSLADICLKITDGSHFSPKDETSSCIPMFSVKDMGTYGFNFGTCKHISAEDYQSMVRNDCVPKVGDVLVAKDGSYLKELFVNVKQTKQAILSSIAIFRPNPEYISPELLLYLLKQPRILQEVKDNYVSGSALPRIVLKDFKKLSFCLPLAEEQCEIRALLSSMYMTIQKNQTENHALASCRDELLSQLVKGMNS